MDINQPTVKLSFDKTTTDLVSVKLRVSFKRERRRFSFPVKESILVTEAAYDKLLKYHETGSARTAEDIRTIYKRIRPHLDRAQALVDTIRPFSFDAFKTKFTSAEVAPVANPHNDVLAFLTATSVRMEGEGRTSNADSYTTVRRSLARFVADTQPGLLLLFDHITPDFLNAYEKWMLRYGRAPKVEGKQATPASLTTVGIYTRTIKAAFNEAIGKGLVSADAYPFGRKKYLTPAGNNVKKALTKTDVIRIMDYTCTPGSMQRGRDLWVFSYLSNGMNPADICHLQWKHLNLQTNTIEFVREKTSRSTKGNQQKITCNLFTESLAIVQRWGTQSVDAGAYVFPFLDKGMDARREKAVIRQVVKLTNKYVRGIAKELEVVGDPTTYAARHSFATILLRSEVPIAFISQKLGHKTISTTEAYLGSFEDEESKKYLNKLI